MAAGFGKSGSGVKRSLLLKTTAKENLICCVLIAAGTLLNNYWVITSQNGFLMDDYSWLKIVRFSTVQKIFTFLPAFPYNDRPVGAIFIKLLEHFRSMDSLFHHGSLLCLHLFNTLMVFIVLKKALLRIQKPTGTTIALIAALIFGMWPNSTMCVQWLAAVFDLLGVTFCLLSADLFLDATDEKKKLQRGFNALFCLVFYYLALRTKEMTIVLPVIFFLFTVLCHLQTSTDKNAFKSFRPPRFLYAHFFLMIFYFAWVKKLMDAGTGKLTNDPHGSYFYTFDPIVILTSFVKYLAIFFQFESASFVFDGFTIIPIIGICFYCLLVGYAVFLLTKGRYTLFILSLFVPIALGPVLPMANMQHRLYWYFPSIFMAVLMAVALDRATRKIGRGLWRTACLGCIVAVGMYLLTFTDGVVVFRNYWESMCQKDRISIQDIRKMPPIGDIRQIYVKAPPGYNVFFYGPGDINAIVFNQADLKTYLYPDRPKDTSSPVYTMHYHPDGHVDFTGIKSAADFFSK